MLVPMRKTVADYMAYDEERVELIDGEFLVTPAPTPRHQEISMNLSVILGPQVRNLGLGKLYASPFDAVLSIHDVVQPDLLFLSNASLVRLQPRLQGPPDVAIEILSKGDRGRDLVRKRKLYLEHGLPEYWLVDPDAASVTVLVRRESAWHEHGVFLRGQTVTSIEMPGVVALVDKVFES